MSQSITPPTANVAKTNPASKGPLPLVIGITGHRDLRDEDWAALEEQVRHIFEDLEKRYPHTPLLLLSPLAEGADRLAARVALQRGARLIVPLPMSRERYETDFQTPASRAEFNELLQQAERWFEVPLPGADEGGEVSRDQQYAAVGAYLALQSQILIALWDGVPPDEGSGIGGTAHVVSFRLHGVPEIYDPQRNPLEAEETGPVCHIVTPRQKNPQPSGVPFARRDLLPTDDNPAIPHHAGAKHKSPRRHATHLPYDRIFERIEGFNRDAMEQEAPLATARQQSESYVLPAPTAAADTAPTSGKFPNAVHATLGFYAVADALSIYFAQLTAKSIRFLFFAVLVAALCFNMFHSLSGSHGGSHSTAREPATAHEGKQPATTHADHPQGESSAIPPETTERATTDTPTGEQHISAEAAETAETARGAEAEADSSFLSRLFTGPWFLVAYLAIVAIAFVRSRHVEKHDYQNKHQDYRALAEGLRIQIFWHLAGLTDSVADYYLGEQRGELEWIRNALRTWNILTPPGHVHEIAHAEQHAHHVRIVREYWIEAQRNYFASKARREQETLEQNERRISTLLRVSLGSTVLLALFLTLPFLEHRIQVPAGLLSISEFIESWHAFLMIAILMLAVGAGLLHGYNQQKAYSEHARQYGRMSVLFDIAERRLQSLLESNQRSEIQNLIRELGKEALAENGDWVLLHRERPLEVPQAG